MTSADLSGTTLLRPDRGPIRTWVWEGELDVDDTDDLRRAWHLLALHPGRVVVDLSAVTFLDCAVVTVLLDIKADGGSRLVLGPLSRPARRLLTLTCAIDRLVRVGPENSPESPVAA